MDRSVWPSGGSEMPAGGDRPVVWLMAPFEPYPASAGAELRRSFRVVWVREYRAGSAVWPPPDVVVLPDGAPDRARTLDALRRSPAASGVPVVGLPGSGPLAVMLNAVVASSDT